MGDFLSEARGAVRYTAVVEMVHNVGFKYWENPLATVWETHPGEAGDVHSVLPEHANWDGLRSLDSQTPDALASEAE